MDYKNGKIYKILNTVNDECYIGSTCQKLSQRMAKHRKSVNSKDKKHLKLYQTMREFGIDKFYIELVKECPCENVEQLRAVEGDYIREMGTLNSQIAGRTKQDYVLDTKEVKRDYDKQYRRQNGKSINQKQRQNYNETGSVKMTCEVCGTIHNKKKKPLHSRSKKHQEALNNLSNINNVSS